MIITKAMPTPQTATTGVSHPIAAGQRIRSGLCRGPGSGPRTVPVWPVRVWVSVPVTGSQIRTVKVTGSQISIGSQRRIPAVVATLWSLVGLEMVAVSG